MEKNIKSTKLKEWVKGFYKKYRLIVPCILTSIPIIVIGVFAMASPWLYHPVMQWQIDNKSWLLPVICVVYCLITEFILVGIPLIMIHKKNKTKTETNNDQK